MANIIQHNLNSRKDLELFLVNLASAYSKKINDTILDAQVLAVNSAGVTTEQLGQALAFYISSRPNEMPSVGDLLNICKGQTEEIITHQATVVWNKLTDFVDSTRVYIFPSLELKSAFLSAFGNYKGFERAVDGKDKARFAFLDFKREYVFALRYGKNESVVNPFLYTLQFNLPKESQYIYLGENVEQGAELIKQAHSFVLELDAKRKAQEQQQLANLQKMQKESLGYSKEIENTISTMLEAKNAK